MGSPDRTLYDQMSQAYDRLDDEVLAGFVRMADDGERPKAWHAAATDYVARMRQERYPSVHVEPNEFDIEFEGAESCRVSHLSVQGRYIIMHTQLYVDGSPFAFEDDFNLRPGDGQRINGPDHSVIAGDGKAVIINKKWLDYLDGDIERHLKYCKKIAQPPRELGKVGRALVRGILPKLHADVGKEYATRPGTLLVPTLMSAG